MTNRYALAALTAVISTLPPSAFAEHRLWYPDWSTGSGTCFNKNETATDNFLFANDGDHDNLYLEETLNDCCARYYPNTEFTDCIEGGGGTVTGTDKWYAWWTQTPQRCAQDCAVSDSNACGGILGPGVGTTYDSVAECCAAHFGRYQQDYCAAISNGAEYLGGGKYYLDNSEHICVQDCEGAAPCGGIVTQSYISMYDTIAECCSAKLPSLDADFCEAQTNPAIGATNKWFVEGNICMKDCTGTGDECGSANAYDTLYDTAAECCAAKLGWATKEYCESRSDPATYGVAGAAYTGLWYEDYQKNACVQDCATNSNAPACSGSLDSPSIKLYTDARTCCTTKFSWLGADVCETTSTTGQDYEATGSSRWYGDYSAAKRCVMDCPSDSAAPSCGGVVSNRAGVTFFDDVTDCCANKFQWYQQDLCKALSEVGPGNSATTNLWYFKSGDNKRCVQDCPTATASPQCAGNPTNFGEPMYDSAEDCCSAKLAWIDKDQCKVQSESGSDSSVASNKWYADYGAKGCAQDCESSQGGGCTGVVSSTTGLAMFDDVEDCCADRFGYMDEALCKAKSDGSGHSGKYYPDQGKGVCHQDCATSSGGLCKGSPSDTAVPMYDTVTACCSGSVGWMSEAVCTQVPASEQGTDEWWINWQLRKCVKNCDGSTGSCGGLANSWDPLFSSASTCCSQPAFTQVEFDDCQKS